MATAKLVPTTTDPAAAFARREKLRLTMRQAWAWARHGAIKFGGSPRLYLAEALRIVWAEKKKLDREIAESRARVLAELAAMKEEGVIAPPRPVARYRTPPPGLRSFTRSARRGALGPVTVRVRRGRHDGLLHAPRGRAAPPRPAARRARPLRRFPSRPPCPPASRVGARQGRRPPLRRRGAPAHR